VRRGGEKRGEGEEGGSSAGGLMEVGDDKHASPKHLFPPTQKYSPSPLSTEFASTFSSRILGQTSRFQRFASTLDPSGSTFVTSTPLLNGDLRSVIKPSSHPSSGGELKKIMEDMIYTPLGSIPWGATVTSGPITSSSVLSRSAISSASSSGRSDETLVFFKASHALGDGVSLGAILGELSDEAPDLRERVQLEMKKRRRRKKKSLLARLVAYVKKLAWFVRGIAMIAKQQFGMLCYNNCNPFADLLKVPIPGGERKRSLAWVSTITVEDARGVSRSLGCSINDLFVACVSKAVDRQILTHVASGVMAEEGGERKGRVRCVIPVHLYGGLLLPGQEIGNRIGAVSAEIEVDDEAGACFNTLQETKEKLKIIKEAPSALVSFGLAKVVSNLPSALALKLLKLAMSGSCVAISNVRGPDIPLNVNGCRVEQVVGFVPPPPSVPIGVVVMSYNGKITITLNGDRRAVPDGEVFLSWILEEYGKLALLSLK
jgi:hypothetical protein